MHDTVYACNNFKATDVAIHTCQKERKKKKCLPYVGVGISHLTIRFDSNSEVNDSFLNWFSMQLDAAIF